MLVLIVFLWVASSSKAKTFANLLMKKLSPYDASASGETIPNPVKNIPSFPVTATSPTDMPVTVSEASSVPATRPPTSIVSVLPTLTSMLLAVTSEPTTTSNPAASIPETYILQRGEYPYCIVRRFNVDPNELIVLNKLEINQNFYTGPVLKIPQTEKAFPGDRVLQTHPVTYTVSAQSETIYSVACAFGDVNPATIAQANQISADSILVVGQPLNIP